MSKLSFSGENMQFTWDSRLDPRLRGDDGIERIFPQGPGTLSYADLLLLARGPSLGRFQ